MILCIWIHTFVEKKCSMIYWILFPKAEEGFIEVNQWQVNNSWLEATYYIYPWQKLWVSVQKYNLALSVQSLNSTFWITIHIHTYGLHACKRKKKNARLLNFKNCVSKYKKIYQWSGKSILAFVLIPIWVA